MSGSGCHMGDFLSRYIALRQKEGAFRECDPEVAVMFVIGSTIHYAMARHVLGAKNFSPTDEAIVEQFVDLILGGLEQRPALSGRSRPYCKRKAEVISWQAVQPHNPCC